MMKILYSKIQNFWMVLALCLMPALSDMANANENKTKHEDKGRFLGAEFVEHPEWFRDSFLELPDDVVELADEDKNLLLYFYQNGCPYCSKLINTTILNQEVESALRSKYEVISLNMWGDRELIGLDGKPYTEKTYSAELGIQFTPSLLFVKSDLSIDLRVNGYRSPASMMEILDYLANKAGDESLASWKNSQKQKNPATERPLTDQPYFMKAPYMLDRSKIAAQRPLAVLFESSNCNLCEQYHAQVLNQPAVKSRLLKMDVLQLDIQKSTSLITPQGQKKTAKQWAEDLNINDLPALILFNKTGEEVIRKDGMLKAFHTQGILEYTLRDAAKSQPSFQRFLEAYADEIREKGQDVNIWK